MDVYLLHAFVVVGSALYLYGTPCFLEGVEDSDFGLREVIWRSIPASFACP